MTAEMTPLTAPKALVILDPATGELIEISTGPLSVEEAAARLPFVRDTLRALKNFEVFLADCISDDMRARGATERRGPDGTLYELKADVDWIVDDAGAMFQVLHDAAARSEITENELAEACQQLVTFRFDHRKLAPLSKRLPRINELRRRVEGIARLRIKSK